MGRRENEVVSRLLRWHQSNRRDFPWRTKPDPYRVLVAEFFLQRTPAQRVASLYESFLATFPTPEALASATPEVLQNFASLGLGKRMRWLLQSAKLIRDRHGGKVPDDYAELIALPGVGDYTASAVLSFGYRRDMPIVDVNVARVIGRLYGVPDPPRTGNRTIRTLLGRMYPPGKGPDFNEAILDFGATVCMKHPLCDDCFLDHMCSRAVTGVA